MLAFNKTRLPYYLRMKNIHKHGHKNFKYCIIPRKIHVHLRSYEEVSISGSDAGVWNVVVAEGVGGVRVWETEVRELQLNLRPHL